VVSQRAKQEAGYGRRGKGYIFGAFRPATGDAMTRPYGARSPADFIDFREHVDGWVETEVERTYVILDNLQAHRAPDVLLFSLAHPRWEFVFRPKYAPDLNLIEPWWKVLRRGRHRRRRPRRRPGIAAVPGIGRIWRTSHLGWNRDDSPIYGRFGANTGGERLT
jgi:transposase